MFSELRVFKIASMLIVVLAGSSHFQMASAQEVASAYPKLAGHFGIIHPVVTFTKKETTSNFDRSYTVGFPTGVNILKSDRIGFSFEIVPFIKAEGGESKMEKFLFHPGIIFRRRNGFSITARAAFETNGRYGFTPVFTKIIKRNKDTSLYLSLVTPARFGNLSPSSVTVGMQVGVSF